MLRVPRSSREWVVAVVSALTGFFFGGAAVAAAQTFMRKAFNLRA